MTGIYVRIQRDNHWLKLELEHLTTEERVKFFKGMSEQSLFNWIEGLCKAIVDVEQQLESHGIVLGIFTNKFSS